MRRLLALNAHFRKWTKVRAGIVMSNSNPSDLSVFAELDHHVDYIIVFSVVVDFWTFEKFAHPGDGGEKTRHYCIVWLQRT